MFIKSLNEVIINLFTIMFGGKCTVVVNGNARELMIHASPALVCALVAFIVAFVLIIMILVGHYSREFKKGTLTVLTVVSICLLLTASILIALTPVFTKAGVIDSVLFQAFDKAEIGTEDYLIAKETLQKALTTKMGADVITAMVCGFGAAISMIVALLGLHLRKAEPVAIK